MKKNILKEIRRKISYLEEQKEKQNVSEEYAIGAINELNNLKYAIQLGDLDD